MANYALRKYGVEATIDFELYEVDGVDLRTDWVPAVADCEVMKDGGTSTQCTNTATDEGSTYSIVLTATEMQAARLVIKIVDAATKVFLDKVIIVETYGNASAQHAFDLDTASVAQGADNNTILSSINIANGAVESDTTYIHGTALTETGGQLAGSFIKFFDVAAPTATALSLPDAVPGAAGGGFIAGTNAATTVTTALTTTFTGDLTGSVGSVTGAVGSVTGAVGSVTGAVGSVGAGGIVAATLGADCITEAKIADNALANEHFANGALTAVEITGAAGCAVSSIGANVITDTAINADAITAAKIADDAISSEHLNTGALTADAFAADAIVAATLATGAFTADAFAADAIVAATFATGAFTADAFAADSIVAATLATDSITADALASDAVDEIWAKAMVDIEAGAPSATASVLTAINYLYEAWRNKTITAGAGEVRLYKDDGATILCESDISDDATDFTKGEYGAED